MIIEDVIITPQREDHMWQAHMVSADEVLDVFDDSDTIYWNSGPGRIYLAYGRATNGRLLTVAFRYFEDGNAYVITDRNMEDTEKRRYRRR